MSRRRVSGLPRIPRRIDAPARLCLTEPACIVEEAPAAAWIRRHGAVAALEQLAGREAGRAQTAGARLLVEHEGLLGRPDLLAVAPSIEIAEGLAILVVAVVARPPE